MTQDHISSIGESTTVFDEEFYLRRYPGVADAVKKGAFASGLQHYKLCGAGEGRVTSKEIDDARVALMVGFCSLGNNCEFGIAQRAFGAEPIDLFRWALTPSNILIRLLSANFKGIGDPDEIEVYATSSGEYHIRHKGYRFAWHAWAKIGEMTSEQIRDREVKRLPFLSRKLVEDMSDGTRIFVVKQSDMVSDTAKVILAAMHSHGRATLMYVTQGAPLGVVREGDCLLHASLPKFADEAAVPSTIQANDWLTVCEQARAMCGGNGTNLTNSNRSIRGEAKNMDRREEILRHIGAGTRGIEVAPWFKPIIPPGGEREVVVLDVFDRPTLQARAEIDPNIDVAMIPQIGEVDLLGSACEIAELVRARFGAEALFDFVISSHNLEHLPDPVRFLRGCEALLTPGGMVAMAVPDKRACFDFFRPHSTTGEILQAFHERRERPTLAQTFEQSAYSARLPMGNSFTGAFTVDANPNDIALHGDLVQQYAYWLQRIHTDDTQYRDTHCWAFTPSSLELILTELVLLGLINFEIVSVTKPVGCEFIVHLRKRAEDAPAQKWLAERRELLLKQTVDELAHASRYAWGLRGGATATPRTLFMIHIPKTAGETINHLLTETLGKERVRTHVESTLGFLTQLHSIPPEVRYISGHHRLPDVLAHIFRPKWYLFLTLRNPVEHLVSHLKWMKSLGAPDAKAIRSEHDSIVQEMASRLWEINLNDIAVVHRFINEEFEDAKQYFDNSQVRYLISYRNVLVDQEDATEAVSALCNLDYVGFTETLSDTCAAIAHALGMNANFRSIPHRNRSPLDEIVNLSDSAIRDFYREAVRLDAFLYTAARNRFVPSNATS
jgi:hypothetical protein